MDPKGICWFKWIGMPVIGFLLIGCGDFASKNSLTGLPGPPPTDLSILSSPVPFPSGSNPPDPRSSGHDWGYIAPPPAGKGGGDSGYVDYKIPADLVVSPTRVDFQMQSINSLNHQSFTIYNRGQKPALNLRAAGLAAPYLFREGAYPGFRGTCTDTLNGNSSCKFSITFQPTTLGRFILNTFEVIYDSNQATRVIPISLDGASTNIASLRFDNLVDDNHSYDFGALAYGISLTKTIRVRYFGARTATGVTFSGLAAPFFIASSSCGEEINEDCDLVIAYQPTRTGATRQKLKVTYHNSAYAAEDDLNLSVETAGEVFPATLSISSNGAYGSLLTATSLDKVFTVSRGGTLPATGVRPRTISNPAFSFKGGTYPGAGGTCATLITADCTLVVSFAPGVVGSYSSALVLDYNNGRIYTQASTQLSGRAVTPALLTLLPAIPTDYGSTPLHLPVIRTFTLTNAIGTISATDITISGLLAPFQNLVGCNAPLMAANSCSFSVTFDPDAAGNYSRLLQITYFDGVQTKQLGATLSAVATNGAFLLPNVTSYDFGSVIVGTSVATQFSFRYYGDQPVTNFTVQGIQSPFSFPGGAFPGGGTCGSSIGDCTVRLIFTPTEAGVFTSNFVITYDDGTGQTAMATIALRGTGLAAVPAVLRFNPVSYDFGERIINTNTTVSCTLLRTGNLSATSMTLSGLSGDFAVVGNTCGSTMSAATTSCIYKVLFTTSQAGARGPQTLTVSYFDGLSFKQTALTFSGTGIDIALINKPSANFGTVVLGQTKNIPLTYHNSGTRAATSFQFNFASVTTPFSVVSSTCGSSLAAGASCTVIVGFGPTVTGNFSGTLAATYETGIGVASFSTPLTGTGTLSLSIAVNNANFGLLPIFTSSDRTLTYVNSGTRTATNLSLNTDTLQASYSVISNNCGDTLAGGAFCSVVIRFRPVVAGDANETLVASYETGMGVVSSSAALMGSGTISISIQTPGATFPSLPMGSSQELPVTFTNIGSRAAAALTLVTNPLYSTGFSVVSQTCGTTLSAGGSCVAVVRFDPIRPGNQSAALRVDYDTGVGLASASAPLIGNATIGVLIAVNGNHSCARNSAGELKCWGQNNYGQLGLGNFSNRGTAAGTDSGMGTNLPGVSLGTNRFPKVIGLGYWHTCVILDDDSLKCWGSNSYGQLGLGVNKATVGGRVGEMGDNLPAVDLGSRAVPVALALGYAHSCALLTTGEVKCWGQNSEGQLGLGHTISVGKQTGDMGNYLMSVDLGMRSTRITANAGHTCALLENQTVRCWGNNFFGQLGLGDMQNRGDDPDEMGSRLPEVNLGTDSTARSVVAGGAFTCALLQSGQVKCWGRNESGILGRGWCQDSDGVPGLCSDSRYPLALRGLGLYPSHLGDALLSIELGNGRTSVDLSAGNSHICAIEDNGDLKCWGSNQYGQLGMENTIERGIVDGDMGDALPAVALGPALTITSIASGNFHNCALFSDGGVKCWGNNRFGGLGLEDVNHRGDESDEMGSRLGFVQK